MQYGGHREGNEGNATLNYFGENYKDSNHDNEIICLSDKTKDRLEYSKLYIEKTVDVFADSIVEANDELTYQIKIKNNSDKNYNKEIHVNENISNYVEYDSYEVNKEGVIFTEDIENNQKINWNIGTLNSGEEVIIKYKVRVKDNCYGQIVESTGKVENIETSKILNPICHNLTENQMNKIKYENIIYYY